MTKEEAERAGGAGEVRKTRTETARVLKGSSAGTLSGSTAADGSDAWVVTSEEADEAGAGGRHGAKPGERDRVTS